MSPRLLPITKYCASYAILIRDTKDDTKFTGRGPVENQVVSKRKKKAKSLQTDPFHYKFPLPSLGGKSHTHLVNSDLCLVCSTIWNHQKGTEAQPRRGPALQKRGADAEGDEKVPPPPGKARAARVNDCFGPLAAEGRSAGATGIRCGRDTPRPLANRLGGGRQRALGRGRILGRKGSRGEFPRSALLLMD